MYSVVICEDNAFSDRANTRKYYFDTRDNAMMYLKKNIDKIEAIGSLFDYLEISVNTFEPHDDSGQLHETSTDECMFISFNEAYEKSMAESLLNYRHYGDEKGTERFETIIEEKYKIREQNNRFWEKL